MLFGKKPSGVEWLIVGLGNPGDKYAKTRHNMGFLTLDLLAEKLHVKIDRIKFKAVVAQTEFGGARCLLMKPQTFMNLSGDAVIQAVNFYKIKPSHVIVVSDEISLPIGKVRVRPSGSAGGHNGLKSIIACLGTDEFPRVRIGVGAPPRSDFDMADWVLSGFHGHDAVDMANAANRAADAVEAYILEGPDRTMNIYN